MGGGNLEWVEQTWVERCGEYLKIWRRRLLCKFLFSWAFFFLIRHLYNVGFHVKYNIEPCSDDRHVRVELMWRLLRTSLKGNICSSS